MVDAPAPHMERTQVVANACESMAEIAQRTRCGRLGQNGYRNAMLRNTNTNKDTDTNAKHNRKRAHKHTRIHDLPQARMHTHICSHQQMMRMHTKAPPRTTTCTPATQRNDAGCARLGRRVGSFLDLARAGHTSKRATIVHRLGRPIVPTEAQGLPSTANRGGDGNNRTTCDLKDGFQT